MAKILYKRGDQFVFKIIIKDNLKVKVLWTDNIEEALWFDDNTLAVKVGVMYNIIEKYKLNVHIYNTMELRK